MHSPTQPVCLWPVPLLASVLLAQDFLRVQSFHLSRQDIPGVPSTSTSCVHQPKPQAPRPSATGKREGGVGEAGAGRGPEGVDAGAHNKGNQGVTPGPDGDRAEGRAEPQEQQCAGGVPQGSTESGTALSPSSTGGAAATGVPASSPVLVSYKAVADFVEALVGCLWVHLGVEPALEALRWLGLPSDLASVHGEAKDGNGSAPSARRAEPGAGAVAGAWSSSQGPVPRSHAERRDEGAPASGFEEPLAKLQACLGYTFRNQGLLLEALTHSTFIHKIPEQGPGASKRRTDRCYQVLCTKCVHDLLLPRKSRSRS